MPEANPDAVAAGLLLSVGLLRRQLRQTEPHTELTLPESAALARLERHGPATSAALAKQEQISPQSMGSTLNGLELRGLVARTPDPEDGRRVILSITPAGSTVLRSRRDSLTEQLAQALSRGFSQRELEQLQSCSPLLERLAQSL